MRAILLAILLLPCFSMAQKEPAQEMDEYKWLDERLDLKEYRLLANRKDLKEIYGVANKFIAKSVTCHFKSDLEQIKNDWARIDVQTCNDDHKDCGDYNMFLKLEHGHWKAMELVADVFESKTVPCFIWRGYTDSQCKELQR